MGVEQAFEKLRERVKPAVLDPSSFANGQIMKAYLDKKGFDFASADDDALATALYEAVTVEAVRLKWLVKPAKVQKLYENEKVRNQTTAQHEQDSFVEKARKSEAAAEYQKKQDAAKKQLDQMIENVQFVDGLRGRIAHGKTDAVKLTLRRHVEKAVKGNRDLTVVVKEVNSYIEKQYEEAEKALERV